MGSILKLKECKTMRLVEFLKCNEPVPIHSTQPICRASQFTIAGFPRFHHRTLRRVRCSVCEMREEHDLWHSDAARRDCDIGGCGHHRYNTAAVLIRHCLPCIIRHWSDHHPLAMAALNMMPALIRGTSGIRRCGVFPTTSPSGPRSQR